MARSVGRPNRPNTDTSRRQGSSASMVLAITALFTHRRRTRRRHHRPPRPGRNRRHAQLRVLRKRAGLDVVAERVGDTKARDA